MKTFKPGERFNAFQEKKHKRIKTTGKFHGKSNTLGQGGRAAQLKAQGVPGGVIGNLARAAHAAPGQKNYHKKTKKRHKKGLRPASAVVKSEQNASHQFYKKVKKHKAKKKLQPIGKNQAYGTNKAVGALGKNPAWVKEGQSPLSKGTLNMLPGKGTSMFKKKKGMKCKKHKAMKCKKCM